MICDYVMYSSWDEYAAEVKSGRLEWSPVHRSDKFWVRSLLAICMTFISFFCYISERKCNEVKRKQS